MPNIAQRLGSIHDVGWVLDRALDRYFARSSTHGNWRVLDRATPFDREMVLDRAPALLLDRSMVLDRAPLLDRAMIDRAPSLDRVMLDRAP